MTSSRRPRGGLITTRGTLQDYIPRPGDPSPTVGHRNDSKRQKWGGRYLISNFRNLRDAGVRNSVTVVSTGNLPLPMPIDVQLRFAANGTNNQPVLPFTYNMTGSATKLLVRVRRGTDPTASPTLDEYPMFPGNVFPIDVITSRNLGVDVIAQGLAVDDTTVWVEAIATPLQDIGPINKVYPWNVVTNQSFRATSAVGTVLLPYNSSRQQFYICNTSTDADLGIGFITGGQDAIAPADLPTWPTTNIAFVLPRNSFAVYESPCPCGFKGHVTGVWSNAGTGGALITEGAAF